MGLFDSLKKIGEDIEKEIEKGINSEGFKDFKNAMEGAVKDASNGIRSFTETNSSAQNLKAIPEAYREFPTFREGAPYLKTTETEKYIRCTMEYPNASDQEISEYVSKINSLGYVKGSEVRYDKGNTYIIVDTENGGLNLVFHIKR